MVCVCTLPASRDKRSQMGLLQANGVRGERNEPFAHVCTIVLIVGIAPNYATFCSRHDGDASPTRVISAVVCCLCRRKRWKKEPSLFSFSITSYYRPADARVVHFPSCREIASPHICCFSLVFFMGDKEIGEGTTFKHV